jgi:hypothetical protein
MRRHLAAAMVLLLLVASAHAAEFVDALLAEVAHHAITAGDVALARGLGLFGLTPSEAPIGGPDVERLVRVQVALDAAERLAITPTAVEIEDAWRAAAARAGGEEAVAAWLDDHAIERTWARTAVEQDLVWRRFIDLRFAAFVFVTDDEVTAALGPGSHPAEARARTRAALRAAEAQRRLDAWLEESLADTAVRRVLGPGEQVPCPVPMPGRP